MIAGARSERFNVEIPAILGVFGMEAKSLVLFKSFLYEQTTVSSIPAVEGGLRTQDGVVPAAHKGDQPRCVCSVWARAHD